MRAVRRAARNKFIKLALRLVPRRSEIQIHPRQRQDECDATYLAICKLKERFVGKDDSYISLGLCRALVDRARLLQVDGPYALSAFLILNAELENAIRLQQ